MRLGKCLILLLKLICECKDEYISVQTVINIIGFLDVIMLKKIHDNNFVINNV